MLSLVSFSRLSPVFDVGQLLTISSPVDLAGDLVNHMDISNQSVPESLVNLAMQNREFHRRRTPVLASNHASSRIAVESSAVQDQGELLPAHKTGQKGRHGLGFKTGDEYNSGAYRATSSSFVRASTAPSSQRDTSNRQTLVICPPKKEQKNSAQSVAIITKPIIVEKKQLEPSPSNSFHQNDAVQEALAKINARIKGSSSEGRQQKDDEKRNSRTFVADDHRRGTRRGRSRSPASSKLRSRSRRRYSGRQSRRSYSSSSPSSSRDESSSNYHRKRYRHQKRSRS